jgi:hypothetical protein
MTRPLCTSPIRRTFGPVAATARITVVIWPGRRDGVCWWGCVMKGFLKRE